MRARESIGYGLGFGKNLANMDPEARSLKPDRLRQGYGGPPKRGEDAYAKAEASPVFQILSRALVAVLIAAAGSTPMAAEAQEARDVRLLSLEAAIALAEANSESDRDREGRLWTVPAASSCASAARSILNSTRADRTIARSPRSSAACSTRVRRRPVPRSRRSPPRRSPIASSELERVAECPPSFSFGSDSGDGLPFGRKNTWRLRSLVFADRFTPAGASRRRRPSRRPRREAAEVGLIASRAELRLTVVESYYNALLGDRLLTIAEATSARRKRHMSRRGSARKRGG